MCRRESDAQFNKTIDDKNSQTGQQADNIIKLNRNPYDKPQLILISKVKSQKDFPKI